MTHQFSSHIATQYGIEEAILIHHFYFWIKKNAANDQNFHDGRYWTYNTTKAFQELFPYMNETKIHRVLKRLVEANIIIKGQHNADRFDRTCWYAFTDEAYDVLDAGGYDGLDFVKMKNGFCQNEMTIPDNNTITYKKRKIEDKSSKKKKEDEFVERMYKLYPSKCPKRNAGLGKSHKDKDRLRKLLSLYSMEDIERVIRHEIDEKYGKAYMSNMSTFLNNFPDPALVGSVEKTSDTVEGPKDGAINARGEVWSEQLKKWLK